MENRIDKVVPEQDERNLAALAHASVILPYVGALVPILIWTTRKDKGNFLAFQALQALIFQVSIMAFWVVGGLCYFVSFLGNILALPFVISESGEIDPAYWAASFVPFFAIAVILLLGFAYIVYGIVAAVMAYQGKPVRYIVVGKWAEKIWRSSQKKANAE